MEIQTLKQIIMSIVYSTVLPTAIVSSYEAWKQINEFHKIPFYLDRDRDKKIMQKNRAWGKFCTACEKEGIKPLDAINRIVNY